MIDKLPNPPIPIGNYVTLKTVNNLIYTSGHVPITDNYLNDFIGKIGKELTDKEGYKAAALVCDLTISTLVNNGVNFSKMDQPLVARTIMWYGLVQCSLVLA